MSIVFFASLSRVYTTLTQDPKLVAAGQFLQMNLTSRVARQAAIFFCLTCILREVQKIDKAVKDKQRQWRDLTTCDFSCADYSSPLTDFYKSGAVAVDILLSMAAFLGPACELTLHAATRGDSAVEAFFVKLAPFFLQLKEPFSGIPWEELEEFQLEPQLPEELRVSTRQEQQDVEDFIQNSPLFRKPPSKVDYMTCRNAPPIPKECRFTFTEDTGVASDDEDHV